MAYEIDYTDTQLPDDELIALLADREAIAKDDAEKERKRWAKARSFRFVGGFC